MDGLVTNALLIAGVGGGGGSAPTIVLDRPGLPGRGRLLDGRRGGCVGLLAELEPVQAEVNKERLELENNPVFEQAELATMLRARGVSAVTARQAAAEISAHPDKALAVHALEELGVDPGELPSPTVAAGASLAAFAVGAVIPLHPVPGCGGSDGCSRSGSPPSPRSSAGQRRPSCSPAAVRGDPAADPGAGAYGVTDPSGWCVGYVAAWTAAALTGLPAEEQDEARWPRRR